MQLVHTFAAAPAHTCSSWPARRPAAAGQSAQTNGALSLQPARTNPPPLRRVLHRPRQEGTKRAIQQNHCRCRIDMMMNKECLFSRPVGKSWPKKNDQSFFCLFCPHLRVQAGGGEGRQR